MLAQAIDDGYVVKRTQALEGEATGQPPFGPSEVERFYALTPLGVAAVEG